jgi:hypothetical protein
LRSSRGRSAILSSFLKIARGIAAAAPGGNVPTISRAGTTIAMLSGMRSRSRGSMPRPDTGDPVSAVRMWRIDDAKNTIEISVF